MKKWLAAFAVLLGMLVIRNWFLFSAPLYELGDTGANSIIVGQAKHFDLLVGNYSRQGFNHPGPAYFYLQAFGEWLFHDTLKIVPTPWNGQLFTLYALNAFMFATVVTIIGGRRGPWVLLALIALIALQPQIINNAWMPFLYVPTFMLFLVACASVASGRPTYLWAVALAGGFLAHGHAVFLMFVPVVAGVAAFLFIRGRGFRWREWLPALGIVAVFLFPMVLNTVLHWPGEFGKYVGYGSSSRAGGNPILHAVGYVAWYWWPTKSVPVALMGVLPVAALIYGATRVKDPFVRRGLWLSAVVTGLFVFYAYAGIDYLGDPYMGFFYWAVPLFFAAAVTIGAVDRFRGPGWAVQWAPLVLVAVVMAVVPGFRTITNDNDPAVPATLAALESRAAGRPIVVEIGGSDIGPELPGLAKWAQREGIRMCVLDPHWQFITTSQFICTDADVVQGFRVIRVKRVPGQAPIGREIASIGHSAFVV
ncbi:hypothetical protein [Allorhizocola rhizosphaerae]|uniref:hypothetical protein n=1 Tax=Allorhizocola rhizosphaerae TaxID=1872709 RepID=UPI000E3E196E|nr:hypothetical protein [Allorhizocola rhizosphaerae]